MTSPFKRLLVGKPIASSEEQHQRIGKPVALAVFASDAVSSTAYATEEMMLVLLTAVVFPQALNYLVPIAVAAVILLVIVGISYVQTIHAYPDGGGAYVVSRENISPLASLVAGGSLLVDYTLTVAVSISSGVLAIGSAFNFNDNATARIGLALFFVALMCVGNLRGLKESGKVFAVPTYFYIVMLAIFLGVGFYKLFTGNLHELTGSAALAEEFDFRFLVGVVSVMGDKDVDGILTALEPVLDQIVVTHNGSPRAMEVEALALRAGALVEGQREVHPPH